MWFFLWSEGRELSFQVVTWLTLRWAIFLITLCRGFHYDGNFHQHHYHQSLNFLADSYGVCCWDWCCVHRSGFINKKSQHTNNGGPFYIFWKCKPKWHQNDTARTGCSVYWTVWNPSDDQRSRCPRCRLRSKTFLSKDEYNGNISREQRPPLRCQCTTLAVLQSYFKILWARHSRFHRKQLIIQFSHQPRWRNG